MVSGLFHRPPGLLFTFPSRYLFAIGRQEYLALESGLPCFPQSFSCSVVLRLSAGVRAFSSTGLSPSAADLSRSPSTNAWISYSHTLTPTTPDRPKPVWFGLFPVRSPLLRESRLISVPRGTEMFQFPRCPPSHLWIQCAVPRYCLSGLPHSESNGSKLACSSPFTFRRSPRPSSALGAKASTMHPA